MRAILILSGLACLSGPACQSQTDQAKTDQQMLQGQWTVTSADTGGYLPWLENAAKGGRLVITGEQLTITGHDETKGRFRLHTNTEPKGIDVELQGEGPPIDGIYELDRATLKLCFGNEKRGSIRCSASRH